MLSSAERAPRPPKPPVLLDTELTQYGNTTQFPVDIVTISQFPSRAAHVRIQESVKPAANLASVRPINDDRTKRIMREVSFPSSNELQPRLSWRSSVEGTCDGSASTNGPVRQ
jgi:hypothetical protein